MKKNRMMRLASILLVCVLLTTSVISGTFAKYTTSASAGDTARVAKWGVVVGATGDTAFAEKYNNAADENGVKVVSSVTTTEDQDGESVLAPGTNGSLGGVSISGNPEVMVDVKVDATLTLTGWQYTVTEDEETTTVEYCPIVFTVGTEEIKIDGQNIKTVADLQNAVVAKFNALDKTNVAVGTDLADGVGVSWRCDFEGDDVQDTLLGNLAADGNAPTITFSCSVTVEQVD